MRFHLCHVQTLLKKAYARAKDQVEDGNARYRESLRKDIGHEAAYQQAVAALDGGEGAADDYAKFLFQAKKYLELRGVPMFAFHKTAVEWYYYYIRGHKAVRTNGPGSGVEIGTRSLLVAEEALIEAGIQQQAEQPLVAAVGLGHARHVVLEEVDREVARQALGLVGPVDRGSAPTVSWCSAHW